MINKRAIEAYKSRTLDSLVWIKKLSEHELDAEIKEFKVKPVFKTTPWKHQKACWLLGMLYPELLLLLDMGTGKSWILQNLINQRIREKKIERALITVPRLINLGTWQDNMLRHSDLEPNICAGTIEEKWERLIHPTGDVTLIDYAGLHWAVCRKLGKKLVRDDSKVAQLHKLYPFIGIDESHLVKNKDSLRYGILRKLTSKAAYSYAATGTLFGRDVEDIWSQFYLVDGGETFGTTLGMFREGYMRPEEDYWSGTKYVFDKRRARALYRAIQHRSVRYDESECGDLPACQRIQIKVKMAPVQQGHYNRAAEGLKQAKVGGKTAVLDANWIRMRQISAGFLAWKDEYGDHKLFLDDNAKLDVLENLLESSGDRKVIVSHEYTPTGELITTRLKQLGIGHEWLYGKTKDPINCVNRFKADPSKKVFVMNSVSGGTGVDGLQDVATYLIFFESPCSPITRKQTEKRIYRAGQLRRTFIYDIMNEGSLDYSIMGFIKEGKDMHDAVVGGQFDKELISPKNSLLYI